MDSKLQVHEELLIELLVVFWFSTILANISRHFLITIFLLTFRILFCCRVSPEMFRSRSLESTTLHAEDNLHQDEHHYQNESKVSHWRADLHTSR